MGLSMLSHIVPFEVAFSADEKAYVVEETARLVDSGWLTKGKHAKQFEEWFAGCTGARYCSSLSSGTAALEAVLRAFKLGGWGVLVPVNTNFGTAAAVIGSGAVPVFYDAGLFARLEQIERAVTRRTRALVIVHIGGYISPEIFAVRAYCRQRRLLLIEDASHAHFAEAAGVKAGNIGDAAAFSLFVTKVLTCGEGGVVTTGRKHVRERVNSYRDQGKNAAGLHTLAGNSWRMSEMNAIVGLAQLRNVERTVSSLRKICADYRKALATTCSVRLPIQPDGWFASGHKFVAIVKDRESRNRLRRLMTAAHIEMGRGVYDRPLNRQPIFRAYASGSFPLARGFAQRHVCLPIYRSMPDHVLARVLDVARTFAAGEKSTKWKSGSDFVPGM
jgi:perosamine synthetase